MARYGKFELNSDYFAPGFLATSRLEGSRFYILHPIHVKVKWGQLGIMISHAQGAVLRMPSVVQTVEIRQAPGNGPLQQPYFKAKK